MSYYFIFMVLLSFSTNLLAGGGVGDTIRVNLESCTFKIIDFYGGANEIDKDENPNLFIYSKIINPKAIRPLEINLTLRCIDPAAPKDFFDFSGSKLTEKGWVMDLAPDVESDVGMHNTFYRLKGKNWDGAGISQDVTNGDEKSRTRRFGFCIPHNGAALCGGGDVAYLNDLKGSALKQVIKMIETIEFVGSEPEVPSPK